LGTDVILEKSFIYSDTDFLTDPLKNNWTVQNILALLRLKLLVLIYSLRKINSYNV
jgi:hypothetical protein